MVAAIWQIFGFVVLICFDAGTKLEPGSEEKRASSGSSDWCRRRNRYNLAQLCNQTRTGKNSKTLAWLTRARLPT